MDRRLLSLLTILALGRVGYAAGPEVEYPSGFRQWARVSVIAWCRSQASRTDASMACGSAAARGIEASVGSDLGC